MKAAIGIKYLLLAELWQARKLRGAAALWFPFYNLACEIKSTQYRNKFRKLTAKKGR